MTTELAVVAPPKGIIATMAEQYHMNAEAFERTMRSTIFPESGTKEQFAAFLLVANEYKLNPLVKEIYAFPDQRKGIVPIVSIDGWLRIINGHSAMDGIEFVDRFDEQGKLLAVTCKIFRKDRQHPTEVTEYLSECKRDTDPWKKWPARMLRHKAVIQCARYAFGFSGIYDEDEAARIIESGQPAQQIAVTSKTDATKLAIAAAAGARLVSEGDLQPKDAVVIEGEKPTARRGFWEKRGPSQNNPMGEPVFIPDDNGDGYEDQPPR